MSELQELHIESRTLDDIEERQTVTRVIPGVDLNKKHSHRIALLSEFLDEKTRGLIKFVENLDNSVTILTPDLFIGLCNLPVLKDYDGQRYRSISKLGIKILEKQYIVPEFVYTTDIEDTIVVLFKALRPNVIERKGISALYAPERTYQILVKTAAYNNDWFKINAKKWPAILKRDILFYRELGTENTLNDPILVGTGYAPPIVIQDPLPVSWRTVFNIPNPNNSIIYDGYTYLFDSSGYMLAAVKDRTNACLISTTEPGLAALFSYMAGLELPPGVKAISTKDIRETYKNMLIDAPNEEVIACFLKKMHEANDYKIKRNQDTLVIKEAAQKELLKQIGQIGIDIRSLRKDIDLINNMKSSDDCNILALIEDIKKVDNVTGLFFGFNNQILVTTDYIYCEDERTSIYHRLGRYIIELHATQNYIHIWLAGKKPHALGGQEAPHVLSGGKLCMGNSAEAFGELFANGEYPSIIALAINFLQSANTSDGAGRMVSVFPRVGTLKDVESDRKSLWEETNKDKHEQEVRDALIRFL